MRCAGVSRAGRWTALSAFVVLVGAGCEGDTLSRAADPEAPAVAAPSPPEAEPPAPILPAPTLPAAERPIEATPIWESVAYDPDVEAPPPEPPVPEPEPSYERMRLAIVDNADTRTGRATSQDRFAIYDVDGDGLRLERDANDLHISRTIGGFRRVFATQDVIARTEDVARRLVVTDWDGAPVLERQGEFRAVWVTADASRVYATRGWQLGRMELTIFELGEAVTEETFSAGGFDLAVDEQRDVLWTVGFGVRKVDLQAMDVVASYDEFVWAAVSIDVADDGSVWVAERAHSQQGGADEVHHFDPDATWIDSFSPGGRPHCVRIDRTTGDVWVAHSGGLTRRASDGTIHRFEGASMWTLAVVPGVGVWAAGGTLNTQVVLVDRDGVQLREIHGMSEDQKYIVLIPTE